MPVGLRLAGKPVLVVGGGTVALRKIRTLLRYHARITVVSPEIRPELRRWAAKRRVMWQKRAFGPEVISKVKPVMVFACTDSSDVNSLVAKKAMSAGIWLNQADSPASSTVHIPSVAKLGPILLAIFSGGEAPVFVKYIRRRLERLLGPHLGVELRLLSEFRRLLKNRVNGAARRKRILTRLVEDGSLEILARRDARERRKALLKLILERT